MFLNFLNFAVDVLMILNKTEILQSQPFLVFTSCIEFAR